MQTSGKTRIALADDDLSDRYLIKMAFEEAGFDPDIEEFENGAELITFLTNGCNGNPPGFILLDINMPKKNGFDVLEFIRNTPGICRAPVIMLSTSSEKSDV